MKLTRTLTFGASAVAFALTLALTPALRAEDMKDMKGMDDMKENSEVTMPETADGILMEIHKHHVELADIVKAKKLADVHKAAFAIRDLANGLPGKVAADKKARVEGSVKNVAKLAEDLDKTGDANDQAATEANLKKLDGVLMVLEKQTK